MLFMVIERFKERDAAPIYERFAEQGTHDAGRVEVCGQLDRTKLRPLLPAHGVRESGIISTVDRAMERPDGI